MRPWLLVVAVGCGRISFGTTSGDGDGAGADDAPHAGCVQDVWAGNDFTCALRTDGTVWCWGDDGGLGYLGDGSTAPRAQPGLVPGLGDVIAIGGGYNFACGVRRDRTLWCWGSNQTRQLGAVTAGAMQATPIQLPGVADVVAVAGDGYHACARTLAGEVQCWGQNDQGQLGNGSTTNSDTPVTALGVSSVVGLSSGIKFTCALSSDGSVQCWGLNNYGQLGTNTPIRQPSPLLVSGLAGSVSAGAGLFHTCTVTMDGSASCWGNNVTGQLGDTTTTDHTAPMAVVGAAGFVEIGAGGFQSPGPGSHTCARRADGTVWCWGWNLLGQLGNGDLVDQYSPVQVMGITDADLLRVGLAHTCVRLRGGDLMCWGHNTYGALGSEPTNTAVPMPVRAQLPCP